jgi:hypothetical protein
LFVFVQSGIGDRSSFAILRSASILYGHLFEQSFGQIAHDSIGAFYPATNRGSTRPEEVWNKRTGRSVWMDERRRKTRPAPLVSLETVH